MMNNGYGDGWMDGGTWIFWAVCGVVLLSIILATALLAVLLGDRAARPASPAPLPDRSEATQLLERRFAAGEIDEDEFRRRRALLPGG